MSELKPCPFCGGEARRIDINATKPSVPDAGASYIACGRCYACSPLMFGEKTGLEESWNRRATSTISPDAQRNIKELLDLFDLQHTSTMEADKLWQKANGKDRLPDLGELIEWLMKRSDPDAVRRECADEILKLKTEAISAFPSDYVLGIIRGYNDSIASIMGEAKK